MLINLMQHEKNSQNAIRAKIYTCINRCDVYLDSPSIEERYGIYKENTCFFIILYYSKYDKSSLVPQEKFVEFP